MESTTTTTAALVEPKTIGMRLDEALDGLTSTQIYILIVALTAIVSFVVLGFHPEDPMDVKQPAQSLVYNSNSSNDSVDCSKPKKKPYWHGVLRCFNFTGIGIFSLVMLSLFNRSFYLSSDSMTALLLAFCAFLGYFFSFSGISFFYDVIDDETGKETPSDMLSLEPQKRCVCQL
jgi:RsiW-degrading membrane proteinase PrsW (M82 family)